MKKAIEDFKPPLTFVELGSAYGGGVEEAAIRLKGIGTVYGFDTFEGHPKDLAEDINSFEATCMDHWYDPKVVGKEKLKYEYQRKILDEEKLDNAVLIKGRVNKSTLKKIDKIHYAFLDMDILASMKTGFDIVEPKLVPGGYLLLHDVLNNIESLKKWYENTIRVAPNFSVISEHPENLIAVLQKNK